MSVYLQFGNGEEQEEQGCSMALKKGFIGGGGQYGISTTAACV
jgi:hypothetical protein